MSHGRGGDGRMATVVAIFALVAACSGILLCVRYASGVVESEAMHDAEDQAPVAARMVILSGTVSAVRPGAIAITVPGKTTRTLAVTSRTVVSCSRGSTLTALHVGDGVVVHASGSGSALTAQRIEADDLVRPTNPSISQASSLAEHAESGAPTGKAAGPP